MSVTHALRPGGTPGRAPSPDPLASPRQLRATRRFVLGFGGPGLARAGRRLGISAGYLSQLLQGTRHRRLRLSELRRLRAPYGNDEPLTVPQS